MTRQVQHRTQAYAGGLDDKKWKGDFGDVLVYSKALEGSELDQVVSSVGRRAGVPWRAATGPTVSKAIPNHGETHGGERIKICVRPPR